MAKKQREIQRGGCVDAAETRWNCAWRWEAERYGGPTKTIVYLRKASDGSGRPTHQCTAPVPPDVFLARMLDDQDLNEWQLHTLSVPPGIQLS